MKQQTITKRTKPGSRISKNRFAASSASFSRRPADSRDAQQKIHEMAYELFVQRGAIHGYDVEDWLQAESIVKGH